MAPNLFSYRIDKGIVHEVPQRFVRRDSPKPDLSEIETPLDQQLRNYFERRITATLHGMAFEVDADPATTSPLPGLIADALGTAKSSFVEMSQTAALHLYACQTGVNPGGLLAVFDGHLGDRKALAVLKLEKESGVNYAQTRIDGKRTLRIASVPNLILSDDTKFFKVSLFWGGDTVRKALKPAELRGLVCDTQRGRTQKAADVAPFFLSAFLGCRFLQDPAVTTRTFAETVEGFINTQIDDPELQTRLELALLTELASNDPAINVGAFAERFLPVELRKPFTDRVAAAGVKAMQFAKDTELVGAQLSRVQMAFDSGTMVIAPRSVFDHELHVRNMEDGRIEVRIEDQLRQVRRK